jgi:glycosyltransferase involved in cell wall biosynthesis
MTVAILLTTYNGEKYLREQLDSFIAQTYQDWVIFASDDGSTDKTLTILNEYQEKLGKRKLTILVGPQKGYASNFLSLVCLPELEAEYFSYSDQDDIWDKEKLERAVTLISKDNKPCLYCARTRIVDANGRYMHDSPLFTKPPSFLNALVQSIGGGNTMIFNHNTLELLRSFGKDIKIIAHDWWTYLVVTGSGGNIYYDLQTSVAYRQHGNNIIGSNVGLSAKLYRILALFDGNFKNWLDINLNALSSKQHLLTKDNQEILQKFLQARQYYLLPRLWCIFRIGIYRQTLRDNVALFAAAVFKKL